MKKLFSLLFAVGLFASIAIGSPVLGAVCVAGLYFSQHDFKGSFAFIQLVPGKYLTALGQEVPMMTRAEKDLFDQLVTMGRANPVTALAIGGDAISFDPIDYYIRFAVTGLSGQQKIVSQSTQKAVGITNFWPQAIFPQYYNFCFDRIAIRTGTSNTANAAASAISNWTNVRASMDPAVANGEIIVRSNRNTILETVNSNFTSEAAVTGGGARNYAGGEMDKSRFFLEQLGIEVELALSGTVSNTANTTTYVEVVFSGVQARLKA